MVFGFADAEGSRAGLLCRGAKIAVLSNRWGIFLLEKRARFYNVAAVQQRSNILIRVVPILIAVIVVVFQRCSSETIVNQAGRSTRMTSAPMSASIMQA